MTAPAPPGALRLGVVCGGTTLPAWQAGCLEAVAAVEGVLPTVFLVRDPGPVDSSAPGRPIRDRAWAVYRDRFLPRGRAFGPVGIEMMLDGLEVARVSSPEEIGGRGLDALLWLAAGAPEPGGLGPFPHGVWAFRFGSETGGDLPSPRLVGEVSARPPVLTAELLRLDPAGTAVVLRRGAFRTVGQSFVSVLDAMYLGVAEWPASEGRLIIERGGVPLDEGAAAPGPRERAPITSVRDSVPGPGPVMGRAARSFVSWQAQRLLWADGWNVGVALAPISSFLAPEKRPEIRWLPELSGPRLLADPFGIPNGDRLQILAEELDLRRGAAIRAVDVFPDGRAGPPRVVRGLPPVASYPFLFEHQGEVYCVPETGYERRAVLYRALSYPDEWVALGPLIEGVAAADPTVFLHADRWWLLCTDLDRGRHGRLLGFLADDLSGPWRPHPGNPLKSDVRNSRPAGTPFVHAGRLYRPAQDSSRTYGGAVVLNRVVRLSPMEFEEEVAAVVAPDPRGPYPEGHHTLSAVGDMTLIDGKRRRLMWTGSRREIASVLRRRLGVGRGAK